MQKASYFVGVDISSEYFTATIIKDPQDQILTGVDFSNELSGFENFADLLSENAIPKDEVAICMETTGVYSEKICYFLHNNDYIVYSEQPNKVKKAFNVNRHKTDSVDSEQIAEYIYRFEDRAQQWQPREDILEKIKTLLNSRELLVKYKTGISNHLHAIKRKEVKTETAIDSLEEERQNIQEKIDRMEDEMDDLVKQKEDIKRIFYILRSAPGYKTFLPLRLIVKTNGFKMNVGYKNLASNIGISPLKNQSGKSRHKKDKSRGNGNAALRKLLRLAARSVVTHKERFRKYYLRKLNEGKPETLVLNNVANKLLKMTFAMVRDGKEYIPNHQSVNPVLKKC